MKKKSVLSIILIMSISIGFAQQKEQHDMNDMQVNRHHKTQEQKRAANKPGKLSKDESKKKSASNPSSKSGDQQMNEVKGMDMSSGEPVKDTMNMTIDHSPNMDASDTKSIN